MNIEEGFVTTTNSLPNEIVFDKIHEILLKIHTIEENIDKIYLEFNKISSQRNPKKKAIKKGKTVSRKKRGKYD